MRIHTTHTRDAALGQLSRINRWLIGGSVLLTAVFAEVAAHAFPGKTIKSSPASSRSAASHSAGTGSSSSGSSSSPLRPPEQAPGAPANSETQQESSAAQPAQESARSGESAPAQESATPRQEPQQSSEAPSRESPAPEASREAAPESSPPVVSGGS